MKSFYLILLMLLPLSAQSDVQLAESLNNIFEISKEKDYQSACVLIAYQGSDPNRKFKASLNSKSNSELDKAERIVKKIKAYLDISDSYSIKNVTSNSSEEFEFKIINVAFKSGGQELEIPFTFVKTENNYLLVSID